MAASVFELLKKGVSNIFYEEIFPNEFIEDDLIIRSDGNVAAGFFLSLPEKETLTESEILSLQSNLDKTFARLPVGTVVHIQSQYFYTENGLKALESTAKGYVTTKIREYLNDRPVLNNRVVMYVIFNFSGESPRNPASTFFSNITGRFKNPLRDVERNKALAKSFIQTFVTQVNTVKGVEVRQMNELGLLSEKLKYFNLQFDKTPVSFSNTIDNRGQEVVVGDEILRVVFLRRTGNQLYNTIANDRNITGFMAWPMGHFLSFPHIVNFSFQICDSEKEMKSLEIHRNIRKALGSMQKQVDRMVIRDIDDFTAEVRETNRQLVYMNHNVMTWNCDTERLSMQVDMVKTAYVRMNGSIGLSDAFNAGNYFFTYSPGMALDMFSTLLMPLDEALLHFDFSTPTKDEGNGIILCNRELEPVLVDLWSDKLPARNRIVIGPSGSGKSYTMNALEALELDQGIELVILDVGGSYKNLFNLNQLKGRYYEFDFNSLISFNPFLIHKHKNGSWNLTEDKVIFLLALITLLWKDTNKGESLNKEEESVITRLLTLYYEHANRHSDEIPRLDRFVPFVKAFYDSNQNHSDFQFFNISSFILVLEKFTNGSYARLFNSDDNENIANHRLVCFDLAGIQNDPAYPVIGLIIIELVLEKVRNNPKLRKEIIIDEAWSMLRGTTLASFIESCFRKIRKSNGAITIVDQSITELKTNAVGHAIKANAPIRILLDHNSQPALIPELQEFFGMTDHEVEQLRSLRNHGNWREMLLIRGPISQVFAIDVGPHASAAFSSWSQDRADIAQLTKVAGPEYAVNQFIENKKNNAV